MPKVLDNNVLRDMTEEEIAKHENVSRRAIRARLFLLKKKMPKLFSIWKSNN